MKKQIYFTISVILIVLFTANYSFAANFATTVGTIRYKDLYSESVVTTTDLINNAADHYEEMGYYNTKRILDPTYTTFISNLVGKVQLFCTHGSLDSITFKSYCGIVTGKTCKMGSYELAGVSDICRSMWKDNTKLVTYICCNTAGVDGVPSVESLAYKTVEEGGVNLSLGFNNRIEYSTAYSWSKVFHSNLEKGMGVFDAGLDANKAMFFYLAGSDQKVKDWTLINDGKTSENLIINKYINSELNSIADTYSIDNRKDDNILESKIEITENNLEENIINSIRKNDSNFDLSNYEISKSACYSISTNKNEKNRKVEFVDIILKIGEFYTNAGYTAQVEDGKLLAIYDNNINIEKQNKALLKKNKFEIDNISLDMNKVKSDVTSKSRSIGDNVDVKMEDIKYFYDIEKDKKYICIPISSELEDANGNIDILTDTIMYEI